MIINWNSNGLQDELDRFLLECNKLAQKYDVFDISISNKLWNYLKNNPEICENFVIRAYELYYVVGKNIELIEKHNKVR